MAREVNIGLVQMAMQDEPELNRRRAAELVRSAALAGAEIVCLPELFTSPYFCNVENYPRDYAESIPGETSAFLAHIAKEHGIVLVGGSYYERSGTHRFNTALVFDRNGENLGSYRKTHIPHDPAFFEQTYFEPGDTGFKVFDTSKGKIGVLICYDQWFPEAARSNALLGADIVFYPTAIGTLDGVPESEGNWQEAWENVQRGHAIANGMVVAAVNRVGVEGQSRFWGGSFVCDAFGKTLIRGNNEEGVFIATVDLDHGQRVKEGWRFFYNRRPNTYHQLTHQ